MSFEVPLLRACDLSHDIGLIFFFFFFFFFYLEESILLFMRIICVMVCVVLSFQPWARYSKFC